MSPITDTQNADSNATWVLPYNMYPRNVCPTTCAVCGDSASGYHYEVPSCNGCKTFFRRTVLSQRRYECKKEGRCFASLPKDRRCSCRACRFQQCVAVGMNPLAIQLVGDVRSNDVVQEILNKRRISGPDEPGTSNEAKISQNLFVLENNMDRMIEELVYLEIKIERFRKSSYNPPPEEIFGLEQALSSTCLLSLADKLQPMPNWPLQRITEFTPEQIGRLRQGLCPFVPREPERKNWFFFDIMSAVEWAKTFPILYKLKRKDQVVLLKSVILQCFNATQAFFSYEHKSNKVIHPDGTEPIFYKNFFDERPTKCTGIFSVAVEPLIRHKIDKKEYVLMKALLLCNPTVGGLSTDGQEILSAERKRYSATLFSYCMALRGMANAPAHYAALMAIIDVLHRQAKTQKDIHVIVQMRKDCRNRVALIEDIMD